MPSTRRSDRRYAWFLGFLFDLSPWIRRRGATSALLKNTCHRVYVCLRTRGAGRWTGWQQEGLGIPLLFVHGVNTRAGPDYERDSALRRAMFQRAVVDAVRPRIPNLTLAPDVYWGGKGVSFDWRMASVPAGSALEGLGPEEAQGATLLNFPELVDLTAPAPAATADVGTVERLGGAPEALLAGPAHESPQDVIDAVLAGQRRLVVRELEAPAASATAASDGDRLARLLLAADAVQADRTVAQQVAGAASDEQVLDAVTSAIRAHFDAHEAAPPTAEELGPGDWIGARLRDLGNGVKAALKIARDPKRGATRVATLVALQAQRTKQTKRWAYFLGDVFEYLRRGQDADGIASIVETALKDAAAHASESDPLILVTHSFGSAVAYDLLSSDRPAGLDVRLWAMAGSQASLFAEMRMYQRSPRDPAPAPPPPLGKPAGVRQWVNIYDPADVLSYLAAPIFGPDAVEDVAFREWGNIVTAHSDYFVEPAFYRLVAGRIGGD